MQFDVVIGNPPYQGVSKKSSKLWPRFFEKAFELTKDNGVVTMVAPATWLNRSPHGAWKHLKNQDVVSLMSNVSSFFPSVASTFAVPLIHKRPYGGVTVINNELNVNLHTDPIPADNTKFSIENLTFLREMNLKQLKLKVFSGIQTSFEDPCYSFVKSETHYVETYYSSAKNRRSIFCSHEHSHYGELKLIVGEYGNVMTTPEISMKAVGRKARYILGTRDELEHILTLIRHPNNKRWVSLMQTDAFSNPLTFIAELP
jgi:hypothetical protein